MATFTRRHVLAAIGGSAAAPALSGPQWRLPAAAAAADDDYCSNTAIYADPARTEGVDYGRRFRRHAAYDDSTSTSSRFPSTVILALHGGGIEPGTSELCLAVAGYHPATMAFEPPQGPVYDFWMFEGLLRSGNGVLHVTATHCDDPVAGPLTAGATRAVSLHGCTPEQAGQPAGTAAVLVGGLDTGLKAALLAAYAAAGITALDASIAPGLGGSDPLNIVNRTFTGRGAQLEMTTPMRAAMFGTNTGAERKNTTTPAFWQFVNATRAALG